MANHERPVGPPNKKRRREATLYDAVAGRVQVRGFLPEVAYTSSTRDTAVVSTQPVPPEEVLFRRKRAPERYEEDDIYFQDRFLSERGNELPASDLLKAVHAYASNFYGCLEKDGVPSTADWGSLDETALIAMGIMLEEQCKYELGATGHLALLERATGEGTDRELVWNGRAWVRSVLRHPRSRIDKPKAAETLGYEWDEVEDGSDEDIFDRPTERATSTYTGNVSADPGGPAREPNDSSGADQDGSDLETSESSGEWSDNG